ncbi:MAG: transcriptional regulator [Anaerolineae bacterium]|nr:transcriptional regulator [Anaerolineae bacterium]MDW8170927.1 WYL domain-containing transcriptional regulator [Anaerolineae bacterium]
MHLVKSNIKKLIDMLLQAYPEGATTGELARRLQVSDQTIRNYLDHLHQLDIPVQGDRRYSIDPQDYRVPLDLSLAEAWLLYLSQRRMVRAQQQRFPVVRSLLHKISKIIHGELADFIAPNNANAEQVSDHLQTLVEGWQKHRVVRIRYRGLDRSESQMSVAPWWFEPSVWTDSNYCIAGIGSDYDQAITLKLDRVKKATLTQETFKRPNIREVMQRIEASWGIWTSEQPVRVVLRFSNRLYDRLHETRWHPTQELRMDSQGDILWSATIAEVQEMKPWIRSWGVDVEVLEPLSLREEIATEVARIAAMYKPRNSQDEVSFF